MQLLISQTSVAMLSSLVAESTNGCEVYVMLPGGCAAPTRSARSPGILPGGVLCSVADWCSKMRNGWDVPAQLHAS